MSEIRIHALRDPQLGAAYLAQDDEMRESVAQIINDIARAKTLRFRAAGRRGRAPDADGVGERVGARHDGGPRLRGGVPPHERGARPRRAAGHRAAAGLRSAQRARVSSEWQRAIRARHHSLPIVGCRVAAPAARRRA